VLNALILRFFNVERAETFDEIQRNVEVRVENLFPIPHSPFPTSHRSTLRPAWIVEWRRL
ncbi:MAG: hypothetical protein IKP64_06890, partial [Selenomonadaceae bacterium]|nr:hypothetical protein [Selenomonadaceae bacterium]